MGSVCQAGHVNATFLCGTPHPQDHLVTMLSHRTFGIYINMAYPEAPLAIGHSKWEGSMEIGEKSGIAIHFMWGVLTGKWKTEI